MAAGRRPLRFHDLNEVVRDAEALLANGYEKAGTWDLAQVTGHLANWLTYPVAGFPRSPLVFRLILRVMRAVGGRRMLEKFLREGMPAGKPTLRESIPPPGGDPAAAVGRLREAVAAFEAHEGEYLPSPLFGRLTRDESRRVQLGHAAHHLSFLVPKAG